MKMIIFKDDDPTKFFDVEVPKVIKNMIMEFAFDECIEALLRSELLLSARLLSKDVSLQKKVIRNITEFAFEPTSSRLDPHI